MILKRKLYSSSQKKEKYQGYKGMKEALRDHKSPKKEFDKALSKQYKIDSLSAIPVYSGSLALLGASLSKSGKAASGARNGALLGVPLGIYTAHESSKNLYRRRERKRRFEKDMDIIKASQGKMTAEDYRKKWNEDSD